MDKPLSQERLSDDELESAQHYLKYGFESTFTKVYGARLINEIKRLQAIEQQNEELRKIIDRQHIQLDKYELLLNQGVDTNETN
jgi:hypothetical protein